MEPLTVVVSFDIGEQVALGSIACWIADLANKGLHAPGHKHHQLRRDATVRAVRTHVSLGRICPAHARSSGSETLSCIRSLAGYIIGTNRSEN
jgi:hypothetical protein